MLRRTVREVRRCKRMADTFVVQNWGTILVGLILTWKVSVGLYYQRGYLACGGEIIIIPMLLAIKMMVVNVVRGLTDEIYGESQRRSIHRPAKRQKRS